MYNEKELTAEIINKNIEKHVVDIAKEFKDGFEFLKKYPKSVTIYGSARLTVKSSHYNDAKYLAGKIVKELGYSIITGGGAGIMEAANCGAKEAGGNSIGLNIDIPTEQHINPYTNYNLKFAYFFTRKTMLNFAAEAYVFFPGGYGTFDELFGVLTLIQTNKIPRVPVILYGKDFWNPLKEFLKLHMFEKHHAINEEDFDLFIITDSVDKVVKIIKEAKVSEWWKWID